MSVPKTEAECQIPEPKLSEVTVQQLVAWLHRVRDDYRRAQRLVRDPQK